MNITFEELRRIKNALPKGSISQIAKDLSIDEEVVIRYFGKQPSTEVNSIQTDSIEVENLQDMSILANSLLILFENSTIASSQPVNHEELQKNQYLKHLESVGQTATVQELEAMEYVKTDHRSFELAVKYVLNKNAELYKRLA